MVDPSGRWLANADKDAGEARLWDLAAWAAARPLRLRRSGPWGFALADFHPRGDWLIASPDMVQLVFWPLRQPRPAVVDGCTARYASASFSSDSRWLVSNWTDTRTPPSPSTQAIRLWPVAGSGGVAPRRLDLTEGIWWTSPVFDPKLRFLFVMGNLPGEAEAGYVVPLDGSPHRELASLPKDMGSALQPALSPSGRLAANAFFYGQGEKVLRIWNLETGHVRDFALPVPPAASIGVQPSSSQPTGYEGGINSLGFVDETTLLAAGHGGIRRWNLETGSQEVVLPSEHGRTVTMALSADGRRALTFEAPLGPVGAVGNCGRVALADLVARQARSLEGYGECGVSVALDPSGTVAATGDAQGVVRVGRVAGGEPHLLLGHDRWVKSVAVSPDLRWVATIGEDKTLRLWPMPDLSKPPLHTLPRGEVVAKLKTLTNLRVVRDSASSTGWKVEVGRFPGWKDVPTW